MTLENQIRLSIAVAVIGVAILLVQMLIMQRQARLQRYIEIVRLAVMEKFPMDEFQEVVAKMRRIAEMLATTPPEHAAPTGLQAATQLQDCADELESAIEEAQGKETDEEC